MGGTATPGVDCCELVLFLYHRPGFDEVATRRDAQERSSSYVSPLRRVHPDGRTLSAATRKNSVRRPTYFQDGKNWGDPARS